MPTTSSPSGRLTAAQALAPVWRSLVSDLRTAEADLRLDRRDAVHEFRVAARRLRSNMVSVGALLDSGERELLEEQLRVAARVVGGARDAEVVEHRVNSLVRRLPEDADVSATRELLVSMLSDSYQNSHERALAYLDRSDYDSLTRRLDRFADLPPWTSQAGAPAAKALTPLLRRQWSQLRADSRKALSTDRGPKRDQRLHDARKVAKRARYLAEAVTPVLGRKAEKLGKVAARGQAVLGDHQDSVMTLGLLAEATRQAPAGSGTAHVLDRLRIAETTVMSKTFIDFGLVVESVERKKLRRWMA